MLVSQNVVVFFNKDVIMKLLMTAVLMMEIAFFGNTFWKTVEVALQKLLWGGGGGSSMTACDFPGYLKS